MVIGFGFIGISQDESFCDAKYGGIVYIKKPSILGYTGTYKFIYCVKI